MTIGANGRDWEVHTSLPDGWAESRGANTAPRGYMLIYNRQPRWLKNGKLNPNRKTALLRMYSTAEYDEEGKLL